MADVVINKFTTQILRDGATPSSPGFVVSEGQDPVNPPGTNNFVPYSGAISNVELGEYGLESGFITLDTTPTGTPVDQGTIYWDDSKSTAALIMNGTTQHIGQDTYFYVKNSSGSNIAKGVAVRFDGTDGASGHLLIAPFLADGTYPSAYFMGVTAEAIDNGEFGQVTNFGEIEGIDTSIYSAGDLLYASTTSAGAFQTTAPVAPNNIVLIAAAVNSKNNGAIIVRPTYGSNINDDEGVKIVSPTTGDLLQLQASGLWENKTKAQVFGGTSSQFVKGDGSLDSTSYQPLLTNPVTGTGTTNFVPKYTSGSLAIIGNSSIQDNGSNITLGNPTLVVGSLTATSIVKSGGTSSQYLMADGSVSTLTNPVTGTGTTNYLPKFTGTSTIGNSQVFDNGTNVGIGTASPQSYYSGADNLVVSQASGEGGISIVTASNTTGALYFADGTSGDEQYRGGIAYLHSTDRLSFVSGGSTRASIFSNGNFVISSGTQTDAGYKLDVNGTGRFKGASASPTLTLANSTGGTLADFTITENTGLIVNSYEGATARSIDFRVANSSALFISSTGATTFSSTVEALRYQATSSSASLVAYGVSVGNGMYNAGTNVLGFSTASTERMRLTSGGNVLVGTTTDNGAKLQLFNSGTATQLIITGGDTSNQRLEVTDGTVTNRFGIFGRTNGDAGVIGTQTNHPLVFNTNNTERMRLTSSGVMYVGAEIDSAAISTFLSGYNGFGAKVSNNAFFLYSGLNSSDVRTFYVLGTGDVKNTNNSYGAISDIKLKENIKDATPKLENLLKVKVRNYNLIGEETKQIGVIAQELEEIFPAMVDESIDKDKDGNDLGTTTKSVKYSVFVPMLIKAIQELKQEIDTLKNN